MSERTVLIPGPDHPITITPNPKRIVVKVAGRTVADTTSALSLKEASYPAVDYIPVADVDMTLLTPTEHETYCPYKGECGYYSIPVGGEKATNAVWTYGHPYPSVAAIAGHVAFYPSRVDSIEVA